MQHFFKDVLTQSNLILTYDSSTFEHSFFGESLKPVLTIAWNKGSDQRIFLDGEAYNFKSNSFTYLTFNQSFYFENPKDLIIWQFDKPLYCVEDNDKEVSVIGFLFWGDRDFLNIILDEKETAQFELLYAFFLSEFKTKDKVQGEMLRALLKRLLVNLNRIAQTQYVKSELKITDLDDIRQFNVLVEKNFKKLHQVQDYANLMQKSPKTLSNVFAIYKNKSPIEIIHDRLVLEAKRLLVYTDNPIKEISWQLGFEEVSHFSRLFKKNMGVSPLDFKNRPHFIASGNIGNR